MKFTWAPGARVKIKAQAAGERIHAIRNRKGGTITPADVLDDARKKSSPLHSHFDWNDRTAAHKYRLAQAGYLIRTLVVVYDEHPGEKPIRSFVTIEDGENRGYEDTQEAMASPEMRAQVLARAKDELRIWTRRYRRFVEFSQVVEAAEGVLV